MTTATQRPADRRRSGSPTDVADAFTALATTGNSGWYDPDGAAWESETVATFEARRATPVRPAISVEGAGEDRDR